MIVTFLAVLELIKSGDIIAKQSADGEDILIKKKTEQDKSDEENTSAAGEESGQE